MTTENRDEILLKNKNQWSRDYKKGLAHGALAICGLVLLYGLLANNSTTTKITLKS